MFFIFYWIFNHVLIYETIFILIGRTKLNVFLQSDSLYFNLKRTPRGSDFGVSAEIVILAIPMAIGTESN